MGDPLATARNHLSSLKASLSLPIGSDFKSGHDALVALKICLTTFPFLIGIPSPTAEEERAIAIDALESGAILCVKSGDSEGFQRAFVQLRPLYRPSDSSTERRNVITGLYLTHLLVDDCLNEFHSEFERLPADALTDPHVSFPIALERQLMVGSYDAVLSSASKAPNAELYAPLLSHLTRTVRDAIADGVEVSYKSMALDEAVAMMKFENVEELLEYVEECRKDWLVDDFGKKICFQPPEVGRRAEDIPSWDVIKNTLNYATELERIV
mmetsp:Transcript_13615/g.30029  ORF Transcript_13615/g.30029 Transcript_13615/m.30029 type:complete len:269 (-) Transcript_13615:84-890(-)|eukprot:CAMPEP_0113304746 /NCGR_PEP_ID=MMETSP0010_2-20120614/4637_1 /TAXON_ID=216773 ORGANISM="Corethron hystrix, Strain 308" /NCGR_SAMPLE_ID=MMETSP0010_2 /ASSEMBLY_ACC=CAM_ASM_000155 /LENGTH=268 /DNA_ID=CAMNT_0000159001 /DNA_START=75 /DNA_END=881 /DNA_ORIENTATION=+ /assembly_acc=CAM_ASM_000155